MKSAYTALVVWVAMVSLSAQAQTPASQPTPPSPAPTVAVVPEELATPPKLLNIRVDIAVVEEGAGSPVVRKEMSLILADRRSGSVRSAARGISDRDIGGLQLSADVRPWVERDGRIRTLVTMNYVSHPHFTDWGQLKFEPLLESGKLLTVSRTSSAVSDRYVRVDVTATILK
jgi:hypothetical protein